MNNPNRRKDDTRPAVALQWGDRPDHWTLMLTGPTSGVIGPLGSTWPEQPAEYERVDVCVRRKAGPVAVHRCGGEGAASWHQFYPYSSTTDEPLKDGELLYREGAAPKLDSIEQYRLQMAAIGTAAMGYWKLGDSIHPDYDTTPLRDVAALFVKYDQLYKFREQVRGMVAMLKNREWAEDLAATGDAAELQSEITEIIGKLAAASKWISTGPHGDNCFVSDHHEGDPGNRCNCGKDALQEFLESDKTAPDAVDAAFADAVTHGTGAFSVHADGSTKHVAMVRDALYPDYATPVVTDAPKAP